MAPYLENSILPASGDFSKGSTLLHGCGTQNSPTPGSLPPTESPPAFVTSPAIPSTEVRTLSSFQYAQVPPVQTHVADTSAFMSPMQQGYAPVQQMVVTTGPPMVSQPYQIISLGGGGYGYAPADGQQHYMVPCQPGVPPPDQTYQQTDAYPPISVAIPQYETAPVQYVQSLPTHSPIQYHHQPSGPVPAMASPVPSSGVSVSPPIEYIQPHAQPHQQNPVYVSQPVYITPPIQQPTATIPTDEVLKVKEGQSISTQLEVVWHGTFNKLFQNFPIKWKLMPVTDIPNDARTFMDSAKVRFICPNCQHCWTSMKGRVIFGYSVDTLQNEGLVVFRLFGQKCSRCKNPEWVHSMWYEEEVKKVIHNVHQRVSMVYYNVKQPTLRIERRKGRPCKPHDPQSCQACEEGVCKEEKNYC